VWAKKQDIKKIMTIKTIARMKVLSTFSESQNFSILENYDGNLPPLKTQDNQPQNQFLKVNAVLKQ